MKQHLISNPHHTQKYGKKLQIENNLNKNYSSHQ